MRWGGLNEVTRTSPASKIILNPHRPHNTHHHTNYTRTHTATQTRTGSAPVDVVDRPAAAKGGALKEHRRLPGGAKVKDHHAAVANPNRSQLLERVEGERCGHDLDFARESERRQEGEREKRGGGEAGPTAEDETQNKTKQT